MGTFDRRPLRTAGGGHRAAKHAHHRRRHGLRPGRPRPSGLSRRHDRQADLGERPLEGVRHSARGREADVVLWGRSASPLGRGRKADRADRRTQRRTARLAGRLRQAQRHAALGRGRPADQLQLAQPGDLGRRRASPDRQRGHRQRARPEDGQDALGAASAGPHQPQIRTSRKPCRSRRISSSSRKATAAGQCCCGSIPRPAARFEDASRLGESAA